MSSKYYKKLRTTLYYKLLLKYFPMIVKQNTVTHLTKTQKHKIFPFPYSFQQIKGVKVFIAQMQPP